jgi:glycosyltransferase involved in cell wall biosynthesis
MNNKILVLTTSFPLYEGIAAGIHVIEKCRHLVKNGYHVQVIAPHHNKSKQTEIIDGIHVKRFIYFYPLNLQKLAYGTGIPTNFQKSFFSKLQVPFFLFSFLIQTLIHARKADIIHCHWSLAGFIGVLAGKLMNKKVVFMMHGAEVFVLGNHPLLRFVLKNCDYLISNSSFTEQKTLEVYPVENHIIISPGVNLERFYPQNNIHDLRKKLNIPENSIFILTIGKFIPRKGIEYLIKAMDILINRNNYQNLYLRIGGRGPLKEKYEQLIQKYQLQEYIEFTGYIPDEDIPSYYTEADMFVLPSIIDEKGDTEGLGVVFLEANACKTPVIGSCVGGIRDVIVNGENGYFVEEKSPEDISRKIELLENDKQLREKLGEKGRERVNKYFNWDSIAKKIIKIYKNLKNEKVYIK